MRIGHGYDVHRFDSDPGRRLVLGGVTVDGYMGLMAHSDGDVLLHAVMDALLGASRLPDIGRQFPDSDPLYNNVDSMLLFKRVCELVREKGFEIEYIDSTIIAQKPKLAPYVEKIAESIAKGAGIDHEMCNVKATTEEGLGFTGRLEGIAAHAVCLLK